MDNISNQKTKPPNEEDEEEIISLNNFPLNSSSPEKRDSFNKRRSSSEPSEFFEFFTDFTSEMSNAEDIIFCGKLVPFNNHHQILKSLSADDATHLSRRCRDSFPEMNSARSKFRSIDRRKFRRNSNLALIVKPEITDIHRSLSKSSTKSEGWKISKPRWFVMMFGPLKLQPEMDLRDMKSRQVRRSTVSLFAGVKSPASRSDRRSFWNYDLLKVLSCKNHGSVAVTVGNSIT